MVCISKPTPCGKQKWWKMAYLFDEKCSPGRCKRINDVTTLIQELKTRVFGQDIALDIIESRLTMKLTEKDHSDKSPLVFHLVGDNGTGKTLTGSIIAENAFKFHIGLKREDQTMLLYQDGSDYALDGAPNRKERVAELTRKIKLKVTNQLNKCPSSIIIIDDIQKMMYEVLMNMSSLFEGGFSGPNDVHVSTRDAIFVLTSDLGREDMARGKSFNELRQIASEKTREFLIDEKALSLLTIIPFVSLDEWAVKKLIQKEFNKLFCNYENVHSWVISDAVMDQLMLDWNLHSFINSKNGRGVVDLLDEVRSLIHSRIDAKLVISRANVKIVDGKVLVDAPGIPITTKKKWIW